METEQQAKRGRGRPLTFDPDEALSAAMLVFWEKGYEGASLSNLTKAMGIVKPSLYARYGNKRRLFLAALDHYNETVGSRSLSRLLEGETVKDTIEYYLSAVSVALTSGDTPPGCLVGSVASDVASRDEEVRQKVVDLYVSTEAFLTKRFVELGDSPFDEVALAESVVTFGQSLAMRARLGASRTELDARVETFMRKILRT